MQFSFVYYYVLGLEYLVAMHGRPRLEDSFLLLLTEVGDGLCCCLKEPCFIQGSTLWQKSNLSQPMVVKKPALNWEEISRYFIIILFSSSTELSTEFLSSLFIWACMNSCCCTISLPNRVLVGHPSSKEKTAIFADGRCCDDSLVAASIRPFNL